MSTPIAISAWARSPVAPVGGALRALFPHELAAPVLRALLAQSGLPAEAVDAVVLGNALGAGGNPARMLALATGLPERCAAHTVDTQCCSGLDAVALAVGLLHSGQAEVVIAGGAEAWSRAPIRQARPLHAGEAPRAYERPAFAPRPEQDPDLLQAAADYALAQGWSRARQEAYAAESHARALAAAGTATIAVAGLARDTYPRALAPGRMTRMPLVAEAHPAMAARLGATPATVAAHGLSAPTISAKADGAGLVLLASAAACRRWKLPAPARWIASASVGSQPHMPLLAAGDAARLALRRAGPVLARPQLRASELAAIELHDAFAVQGLAFCEELKLDAGVLNQDGGGLARGHPIGASGAIALVQLLARLQRDATAGAPGLAAIAGAGGIGAACIVQWTGA